MKTLEELKDELKEKLSNCTYINDGSLASQVNENIQWVWDNWDIDFSEYYNGQIKPENYTSSFRNNWIDNEPFDIELEQINYPS
jgi:hypothetical protein